MSNIPDGIYKRASARVDELLPRFRGQVFTRIEMYQECGVNMYNPAHRTFKEAIAQKLYNISDSNKECKNPILQQVGRNGYRVIEDLPEPVDWQNAETGDFPVILPFDLRKYVVIEPDSCMIFAGSKDSGKTGALMRIVALNMLKMNVVFLSNMEGGKGQIRRRFEAMDIEIPNPPPFKLYHVTENFHDVIKEPNTLYVIDYIDVPDTGEFYMIPGAIGQIQKALVNLGSVAAIGLQKKRNSDDAYGGEQTKKKATLYLAMNPNKIKIVLAKVWADKTVNPVNMQWTFQYANEGTNFLNLQKSYEEA